METICTTIENYLAPELLGQPADDLPELVAAMNRAIAGSFSTGQPICKSAVELALWDLNARAAGVPLHALWGLPPPGPVPLSWTVSPAAPEEVAADVSLAQERGYRSFNVKVGADPTTDVQLAAQVRALAPAAALWADANGGYALDDALAVAPRLAELGCLALEQPLPANRLSGYARLRKQGALPIVMDEGVVSCVELAEFHQLGLLDGVALKVARCGGLAEARRQAEYARSHGLLLFGSGLTDPDLALAASVQLLGQYELVAPAALNAPQYLPESNLVAPLRVERGVVQPPGGSGLGAEFRADVLEAAGLQSDRTPAAASRGPG